MFNITKYLTLINNMTVKITLFDFILFIRIMDIASKYKLTPQTYSLARGQISFSINNKSCICLLSFQQHKRVIFRTNIVQNNTYFSI
jgi:hypothetical protein